MLEKLKDVTLIDAPVTIKSAPKQETLARLEALADKIAEETVGKKTECREIASFVDGLLLGMNFTRSMLQPIPNERDATIYRITGRYRVLIDAEHVLYRR